MAPLPSLAKMPIKNEANKRWRDEDDGDDTLGGWRLVDGDDDVDYVSVALVTLNGTGAWIRLDTEYKMPEGSPPINVGDDITYILVRQRKSGKFYFGKISNLDEITYAKPYGDSIKEDTYEFRGHIKDALRGRTAEIRVDIAVSVKDDELDSRLTNLNLEFPQEDPGTNGIVKSIEVEWL